VAANTDVFMTKHSAVEVTKKFNPPAINIGSLMRLSERIVNNALDIKGNLTKYQDNPFKNAAGLTKLYLSQIKLDGIAIQQKAHEILKKAGVTAMKLVPRNMVTTPKSS